MLRFLSLWAQLAGSNGNCMVDSVDNGTAVLLCGFVDGAYGWDDSAGVSVGEYPASWLGPEGSTTGQLNAAVNGAILSVRTALSAGDDGGDIDLNDDCAQY